MPRLIWQIFQENVTFRTTAIFSVGSLDIMQNRRKIMIIAGEASGDLHGAKLASEIKTLLPNLEITGLGGASMKQAGVELITDISNFSVCGFFEVIRYLPRLISLFNKIKRELINNRPDLLILIDYPTFNLKLAKVAAKHKIKVLYYISPQIWAWHTSRVKKIRQCVNMMAVIFPFESEFYRNNSVPVKYVGHPLVGTVSPTADKLNLRMKYHFADTDIIVGLLPGSRNNEIKYILPTLLKTAQLLHQKNPHIKFVLPLANTLTKQEIGGFVQDCQVPINIIAENRYDAMSICNAVVAASGTVTLELTLLQVPMVIVYKANVLSFKLAKYLVKIPHISLCNIVAGEKIVTELLQQDATAENISAELLRLIEDHSYRNEQTKQLQKVSAKLATKKECNLSELVVNFVNM